jgi:hypothetical protein
VQRTRPWTRRNLATLHAALGLIVAPAAAVAAAPSPAPEFETETFIGRLDFPTSVEVADFTGDRRADIVYAANGFEQGLELLKQRRDGSISKPEMLLYEDADSVDYNSMDSGDLDGDGATDLVAGTTEGVVAFFSRSGTLKGPRLIWATAEPERTYRRPILHDADKDGDLDLIVSSTTLGAVVAENLGNHEWVNRPLDTSECSYGQLGELNGDDRLDLLCVTARSIFTIYYGPEALGEPWSKRTVDTGLGHRGFRGLSVGDLTGDGQDDIAMSWGGNVGATPPPEVDVFSGPVGPGDELDAVRYPTKDLPTAIVTAPVDLHQGDDLVVPHDGWSSFGLYSQLPDGTLAAEHLVRTYSNQQVHNPEGIRVADVSGDNLVDVVGALVGGYGLWIAYQQPAKCTAPEASGDSSGTADVDILRGDSGPNSLMGLGGRDVLCGRSHGDELDGGAAGDILQGGEGADQAFGAVGDDHARGDAGNDVLRGGPGRDFLKGGPGTDLILGGPGVDTCQGTRRDVVRSC